MIENVTENSVYLAIQQVEHPAIASSLVDLGMIRDIVYSSEDKTVSLTLVLPVLDIPQNIRDYMIHSLYQALKSIDTELTKVNQAKMTAEERQVFLTLEQQNWKGQ
jgi:metal-sulfur cluster biosynthetic enzyme